MGREGEKLPASLAAPRLYDLEADIGEKTDVAGANPEVVERLRGLVGRMAAEILDPNSPARRPPGQQARRQAGRQLDLYRLAGRQAGRQASRQASKLL